MLSAWWWVGLGVAAGGAGLLGVAGRSLRSEAAALRRARRRVQEVRRQVAGRPGGGS